jgi:hypothetical protein
MLRPYTGEHNESITRSVNLAQAHTLAPLMEVIRTAPNGIFRAARCRPIPPMRSGGVSDRARILSKMRRKEPIRRRAPRAPRVGRPPKQALGIVITSALRTARPNDYADAPAVAPYLCNMSWKGVP